MADCDGFFENEGIPYLPQYENEAVRAVLSADFYDPPYKKWLIMCWFDTTYGEFDGSRFVRNDASDQMARYLRATTFDNYEDMIESRQPRSENPS